MSKKPAPPLQLYRVTLDWATDDDEQGDYCILVWATDDADAIRAVAVEMADSGEIVFDSKAERAAFIAERIDDAGVYAAERVADGLASTIHDLLAGPLRQMSAAAQADYDTILRLLARYGVTP
jgi:hypothetical protein